MVDTNTAVAAKAGQLDLDSVSKKADDAVYRLGEGRVSMGWAPDALALNFYVDGVFIGGIVKSS